MHSHGAVSLHENIPTSSYSSTVTAFVLTLHIFLTRQYDAVCRNINRVH